MTQSNVVIQAFKGRVAQLLDYHSELMLAVHLKRRQATLETMLVEQLVMSLAVLWEAFLTDLFVAYITMSPAPYLDDLELRIGTSLRDRFGPEVAKTVHVKRSTKLSRSKVVLMLDPKGWNISVTSATILAQRANQMLAAPYARKFSLSSEDGQLVDLLICIRNYLSHRSPGSRKALKEAIQNLAGASNGPLTGQFRHIGSYLKYKNGQGQTRAKIIADRVSTIAGSL